MNKALKKTGTRAAAIIVSLLLMLSVATGLIGNRLRSYADDAQTSTPVFDTVVNTDITNPQFGTFSGEFPKTPENWTGAYATGEGGRGIVSGVIDFDSYSQYKDKYKLEDDYSVPTEQINSPFGTAQYPGTNRNALLINIRPEKTENGTVYGYTSGSTIAMSANKYYEIGVWVRTGNFKDGTGASIRLNGLDGEVGFSQINTLKDLSTEPNKDNWYGWTKYRFYIGSPSIGSKSVSLTLSVGDSYKDKDDNVKLHNTATGYALFDNISVYEISADEFYENKLNPNSASTVLVKDFSDLKDYYNHDDSLNLNKNENWNFTKGETNWSRVSGGEVGKSHSVIIDGYSIPEQEKTKYNLTEEPGASLGDFQLDATAFDNNILLLSSYTDQYNSTAVGFASKNITIERYKYYRVSFWVKTQDISGGDGATAAIFGKRSEGRPELNLFTTTTGLSGDTANTLHAGWKQYSFFIEGSLRNDLDVQLQLWLGTAKNPSRGIAMFDNVSVSELTPQQFTEFSGEGTLVNVDTDKSVDGSDYFTYTDTGISNGDFYKIGAYTKFEYPMLPADWTKHTVDTVGTEGYSASKNGIDYLDAQSGLIPTNEPYFSDFYESFKNIDARIENYVYNKNGAMLMLYSKSPSAYCYRSANFTATLDTAGKVEIELAADKMTDSDYGASLVLKQGNKVIATIEQIKNTNGFKTYTFFIEAGSIDTTDLSVEIWLGMNDRVNNTAKRSAGFVYANKVSYQTLPEGTTYADSIASLDGTKAAYSLKSTNINEPFTAFDRYDTEYVKYPYNWSKSVIGTDSSNVSYGIFRPKDGIQNPIPSYFENAEATNDNVLMLFNKAPAFSKLTYSNTLTFKADLYYKLTVKLKVDLKNTNDKAVGAGIGLSGTKFKFSDIRSTTYKPDSIAYPEIYRTYTFYINPGSAEGTGLFELTLGNDASINNYSSGFAYINELSLSEITSVLYDTSTSEKALEKDPYSIKCVLSETTSDEKPEESDPNAWSIQWWLIPSILLAVAILIAIIGVCIRKIVEKRAKKVTYEKTVSYDRKSTLNQTFNDNKTDESEKLTGVEVPFEKDKEYDAFSDEKVAEEIRPTNTKQSTQQSNYDTFNDDEPIRTEQNVVKVQSETAVSNESTESKLDEAVSPETEMPKQDAFDDGFED